MSAKPVQIKIEPNMYSKAEAFAQHEGFRSVASMAYYAFVQFINELEEEKIASWIPTDEEKAILLKGIKDFDDKDFINIDPKNLSKSISN